MRRLFGAGIALTVLLAASSVAAETYVWTDEHGRVHMTDDLSQVPVEQRARAERSGREATQATFAVPEGYRDVPVVPSRNTGPTEPSEARPAARRHVLRVERVGDSMRVVAQVDGIDVPFILDTGASICTLPGWAVEEIGAEVGPDTPRIPVSGISGRASLVPEIRVGSVRIGDAEVEDLRMAVLDTMPYGLLGMPFFNHFKAFTDPVAGTLVLEEIDLDAVDGVAGGLNERAWRKRFRQRHYALARARARLESEPEEAIAARRDLEAEVEYWEQQLELLEIEARHAEVPMSWRE